LTLVKIYALNKDEPSFFQNVGEKLSSFDCDFKLFGGDFNLACDIHKDKENFELTDIWRVINPDATKTRNPMSFRFFLISNTLCPVISNAEILSG